MLESLMGRKEKCCPKGHAPELVLDGKISFYVRCRKKRCWIGPNRKTKNGAWKVWNTVMRRASNGARNG